jgi:signal transduction histidine kinase
VEDLSLHILDIVENSLRANARNVGIRLLEDPAEARVVLEVTDDGDGMDPETLRRSTDPFFTTKDGKKAGLGLAFLAESAREAGGTMEVVSEKGKGTKVVAVFGLHHIDRVPLGDIEETLRCLRATHPDVTLRFEQERTGG